MSRNISKLERCYIYKSQISLLSLMSSHSLRQSIYLLSPYQLAFHYSPAWEIVSLIKQVTSGDFLYSYFICIRVSRSRDSPVNIHTSNIVNWYQNRSLKTISSYILWFEHSRRLNSIVSNHANNGKFGRMQRWFWHHLLYIQYEHEGVKIAISILEFQT